ncbi:hypothetical protein [Sneathiella glossodoripedis]|uniref:hypothetical protein n=1 Tax=Sneathiella glossodoripedis TaxID=418853 RepID=UPI000472661E|nr:hypothetical protein [Sneathiella glossodoripedis]
MKAVYKILIFLALLGAFPAYCTLQSWLEEDQYFVVGNIPIFLPKYAFKLATSENNKTDFLKTYVVSPGFSTWNYFYQKQAYEDEMLIVSIREAMSEENYKSMLDKKKRSQSLREHAQLGLIAYSFKGRGVSEKVYYFPTRPYHSAVFIECTVDPYNLANYSVCFGKLIRKGLYVKFTFASTGLINWENNFEGVIGFIDEIVTRGQIEQARRKRVDNG